MDAQSRASHLPRRTTIAAFALAATLLLAACGSTEKKAASATSRSLTIPFVQDMSVPDPDVFYDVEGDEVTQSTYEGLVRYAPNSTRIVGQLAKRWAASPDGKTITFHLRKGVVFHDGATMTSADVKRSFERRAKLGQGSGYMVAGIASMQTPDPQTFVVKLKGATLPFMDYLASLWGPRVIGPEALVKHAGSDRSQTWLGTHDDGTGPYELTSFMRGTRYELTAFPKYWGAKPYYTKVAIEITPDINTQQLRLRGGDLAMMLHGYPESSLGDVKAAGNLAVGLYETGATLVAYLNTNKAPLSSLANRVAVAKAIDPQKIVAEAYGPTATVATGPYPPSVLTNQPKLDYGQGTPATPKPIAKGAKITLAYAADEKGTLGRVAQLLQVQLAPLGLNVTISEVPHPQIYDFAKHPATAPDIVLLTNNPDAAHPDTWASINWGATGGTNLLAAKDPTIDALLAKALKQTDKPAADAIYRTIGAKVIASHEQLFLANVKDTIVYNKSISGLQHTPLYPWMVDLAALKPAS
ncbi:MAG TPA: ABC transporter substrate-binding protein [Solirubrobacteraceae bacterium]|jgi:peptide/nickel transport system substrate-binding protein|nr:ABC transporter substrate-binding protein [Solirubrobacteraceae bacterium]